MADKRLHCIRQWFAAGKRRHIRQSTVYIVCSSTWCLEEEPLSGAAVGLQVLAVLRPVQMRDEARAAATLTNLLVPGICIQNGNK